MKRIISIGAALIAWAGLAMGQTNAATWGTNIEQNVVVFSNQVMQAGTIVTGSGSNATTNVTFSLIASNGNLYSGGVIVSTNPASAFATAAQGNEADILWTNTATKAQGNEADRLTATNLWTKGVLHGTNGSYWTLLTTNYWKLFPPAPPVIVTNITGVTTNIIVTGALSPNMTGTYTMVSPVLYQLDINHLLFLLSVTWGLENSVTSSFWTNGMVTGGGVYYPAVNASGIATATWSYVTNYLITTNAPTDVVLP